MAIKRMAFSCVGLVLALMVMIPGLSGAQADFTRALGYPLGYPGDSRAEGTATATVLEALGLNEISATELSNPGVE